MVHIIYSCSAGLALSVATIIITLVITVLFCVKIKKQDRPTNVEPIYEEIELRVIRNESGNLDHSIIKLEMNSCYGNANSHITMNECSAYDTLIKQISPRL